MKQAVALALGSSLVLGGCDSAKPGAGPEPAVAAAVASASALPVAPKTPWFVGKWSGKLKTEAHRIEMTRAEGAVLEWAKDDGKTGVGEVSLELEVNAEGEVSGGGQGALGELLATGRIVGDDLRLQLRVPTVEASKAFSGVLVASRSGDLLKGKMQVSTGDSLTVRRAEVTLEKAKATVGPRGPTG